MKVGLIGLGGMGFVHYNAYKKMADIEIAVADIRVDMAKEKIKDDPVRVYSSLEELLDKENPDFIDICTPSYMHADMSVYALEAGKHVLCEKPMSISSKESERMIAAAEKSGKMLMIAHVVRFMSPYVYLKSVIDSGELGKPVHIVASRISQIPLWSWEDWMRDTKRSGGAPIDLSIHDIDFFSNTFGQPIKTMSSHCNMRDNNDFIDSKLIYDGFTVDIIGGWYNAAIPFSANYNAIFENGYVQLKDGVVYKNGKEVELERGETSEDTGINLSGADGYADEIAYFVNCIKTGTRPTRVTPESSCASVRLAEQLIATAESV